MSTNTQTQETNTEAQNNEKLGICTMYNVTSQLFEKAADKLTKQEIEWISYLFKTATIELGSLEDIVNGVGCLIGNDNDAGNFQNKNSISTLLFSIANQLNSINTMFYLSGKAEDKLKDLAARKNTVSIKAGAE